MARYLAVKLCTRVSQFAECGKYRQNLVDDFLGQILRSLDIENECYPKYIFSTTCYLILDNVTKHGYQFP